VFFLTSSIPSRGKNGEDLWGGSSRRLFLSNWGGGRRDILRRRIATKKKKMKKGAESSFPQGRERKGRKKRASFLLSEGKRAFN